MLPLAFDLGGRRVLVLGAGTVGTFKASQLLEAGALVSVVTDEIRAVLPRGITSLQLRPYAPGDLEGYCLVVSAIGVAAVNDRVVEEARDRNVAINVVDDPERSNFFFTAVHRTGDVVVSVSTEGASPTLAQVLRDRIRDMLPANTASVATTLRAERAELHRLGKTTEGIDWRAMVVALLEG